MYNCPYYNCPFSSSMMRDFDNLEDIYFDGARASWQEVNRIFSMLVRQRPDLFRSFARFGVNRGLINNYFRTLIAFTIDNSRRFTGSINQKTNAIYESFRRRYAWIFGSLRAARVPPYIVESTFKSVIEFTLRNIRRMPGPGYGPGAPEGPGFGPGAPQGPGFGPGAPQGPGQR